MEKKDSIFMASVQMNRGEGFKHESIFLITIKKVLEHDGNLLKLD